MAKRWSRVEDRRAASRFDALDYEPLDNGRVLTPAEVRAAVGVEKFEEGTAAAAPIAPVASALAKAERQGHVREDSQRAARTAPGAEREADTSASSNGGSNTSSGGGGGSGATGGAEKKPWTWPAHTGAQGAEKQRLDALQHFHAQHGQAVGQPRSTAASSVGSGSGGGRSHAGTAGSRSKDTPSTGSGAPSGSPTASGQSPWRAPRMPKRPKSIGEERAMLASFGRPVVAQLHEHEEQHKDTGGGASWWQRARMETSQLWHEARDAARDWVQNKWNPPGKGPEPHGPGPIHLRGPDIER